MYQKKILFIISLFYLFAINASAQVEKPKIKYSLLKTKIDSILQSEIKADKIPGAVIQIKQYGKIIYSKAYGYAQKYNYPHVLLSHPEKMTVNHLFDLASLTKVIGTTTSLMLLADRGLLKVDDPVGKYIPAFNSPDKKGITIRNLLTHTAGLYEWYPLFFYCHNKEQSYEWIGKLPLKYPVGGQRKYSDLGFILLGEIIEHISHASLEDFMEENIFKPLGMDHTTYNPLKSGRFTMIAATSLGNPYEYRMTHDSTLGFMVKGTVQPDWNGWRKYTLRGEVNDGNAWYANGGISGAAGLFSTVTDIQKLVDMLINNGKTGNHQFLTANTIHLFLTQDRFKNGLGWMMDPENSLMKDAPEGSFGHTGFTGTSIAVVPSEGISIILLINRQNIGLQKNQEYYNVGPIRQKVFEAVLLALAQQS